MPDDDLRLLERAWRTSGSDADEAALLRARIRAGLLTVEALERAEALGHAPASLVLEERAEVRQQKGRKARRPGKRKTRRSLRGPSEQDHHGGVFWIMSLESWGREACVRAAVAVARLALPRLPGQSLEARLALRAIEAAEAWIVDPTKAAERSAGEQAERLTTATSAGAAAACARLAAAAAGRLVADRGPGVDFMGGDLDAARRAGAGEAALDAASSALRAGFDPGQIRDAIRADLVPWLLGGVDPVKLRFGKGEVAP